MNLKIRANTFALLLFLGGIGISPASQAQTTFEQLRHKFEAGQIFYADFTHTSIDSFTQETLSSEGRIWINQVGYKLVGGDKTIVVDGELSTVYESGRNRVIISAYEPDEDDFAPSRMLGGLNDTYTTTEEQQSNGTTIITLTTADDFAVFVQVEIEVDQALQPIKITAYDIADNIIITTFTDGSFMDATEEIFKLEYPADAELIDMRN